MNANVVLCLCILFIFVVSNVESSKKERDFHYKVLGVDRNADARQIKKAYREMSKKWHPDVAKTEADKEKHHEKMIEINRAYEILNDPQKRERYDMFGDDEDQPQQPSRHPFGGGGGFGFGFDFADLFGGGFPRQRGGHGGHGGGRRSCVQTVTCRGNICTQTTTCT